MRYTISLTCATAMAALTLSPALAEVPKVVTDMPPIQSLVAQVMGDLGTPDLLLERGASPHSFQLRPSQAAAVADADLVIWTGPEMAPWLSHSLEGNSAAQLSLLTAEGTYRQPFKFGDDDDDHAEGDQDGTAEAGHDHDHDHDHSGLDPHAWLDPDNASLWLDLIAAELAKVDPEHAATYDANAAKARADLAVLDADLKARLAPVADRPIIVFHDAYGYFAGHYGLTVAGAVSLGDAASPGAARLSDLRRQIDAGTPVCIFPESQFDPALVAQMADGTDIRIGAPLDPEGSTLEPGQGLYASLLTGLATSIADCLNDPA